VPASGLLPGGSVRLQRRADGLQGDQRQRHVGPGRLADKDLVLHLAQAAAAELGGPADPEPAVAAHPAHDLAVDGPVALGEHRLALTG
jgi:hypothetical protein